MKISNKKNCTKLVIGSMAAYKEAKGSNFERGSMTQASEKYSLILEIKSGYILAVMSKIKCFNKLNSKTFQMSVFSEKIIELSNDLTKETLLRILDTINSTDETFDIIKYLEGMRSKNI